MCAPQYSKTTSHKLALLVPNVKMGQRKLSDLSSVLDLQKCNKMGCSDHSILTLDFGCGDGDGVDEEDYDYDQYVEIEEDPEDDEEEKSVTKKATVMQSPPLAATAVYLFAQFNVSLYLSQSITLTGLPWLMLVNGAVAAFLFATRQYRRVLARMRVADPLPLSVSEIITGATLLLLVLQQRSIALWVLVGGLLYMALATAVVSGYLLAVGEQPEKRPAHPRIPSQIVLCC